MNKRLPPRDVETLSAYLDGELTRAETARLEARLASDPSLRVALDALRRTRAVLRHTPQHRAPRNFTLTPRQVAANPPMPRLYSFLRLASALATVLFFLTFAARFVLPVATAPRAAPMAAPLAAAPEITPERPPAMGKAPATPAKAPVEAEPQAEQSAEEAFAAPPEEENASPTPQAARDRLIPTPLPTIPPTPPATPHPIPPTLLSMGEAVLAALALLSALAALVVRHVVIRSWQKKKA